MKASKIWVVDAFVTEKHFSGNPAGVCIVDEYDEELCSHIALELNLSETAFIKPLKPLCEEHAQYENWFIRWWTPKIEVKFCGHATLASAHLLYSKIIKKGVNGDKPLRFVTSKMGDFIIKPLKSGVKNSAEYVLNFPIVSYKSIANDSIDYSFLATQILNCDVKGCILNCVKSGDDLVIQMDSIDKIRSVKPNISKIEKYLPNYRTIVITAAAGAVPTLKADNNGYNSFGDTSRAVSPDFVVRVFGPMVGVNEDPVTGSVHCGIIKYWSDRLDRPNEWLLSHQLSDRGGIVHCKLDTISKRVLLRGSARVMIEGHLFLPINKISKL